MVTAGLLLLKRNAASDVAEKTTRIITGKGGIQAVGPNGSHRLPSERPEATEDPSQFVWEFSELWSSQERPDHGLNHFQFI